MPTYHIRIRNLQTQQETIAIQMAASPEQAAAAVRHLGKVIEVRLNDAQTGPAGSPPQAKLGLPSALSDNIAQDVFTGLKDLEAMSQQVDQANKAETELRVIRHKATYKPLPILLGIIGCLMIIAGFAWLSLFISTFFQLSAGELKKQMPFILSALTWTAAMFGGSVIIFAMRAMLIGITMNVKMHQQLFRKYATTPGRD